MLVNFYKKNLFTFLKQEKLDHLIQTQIPDQNVFENIEKEKTQHIPVMLQNIQQIIKNYINKNEKQFMIDCTLGCGGHSINLVNQHQNLHIIGLDLDPRMIENIHLLLNNQPKEIQQRLVPLNINFKDISGVQNNEIFSSLSQESKLSQFNFILADLGYSSWHLKNSDWGFSYMDDGVLDMRYQQNMGISAADLLNNYDEITLIQLLQKYGDFRSPQKLVKAIIKQRQIEKFLTTGQLKNFILHHQKIQKKFKTLVKLFQTLRIAVNDEMNNLHLLLQNIEKKLQPKGIGMIITFHSLEYETVAFSLQNLQKRKIIQILEKKMLPSKEEIKNNVRSRSAILQVFQKK